MFGRFCLAGKYSVLSGAALSFLLCQSADCSDGSAIEESARTSTNVLEVVHGPLEDKRKSVLSEIMSAKNQGCGISAYLAEFNRIEDMVKSGQPVSIVEDRLDRLHGNLKEQLQRAQILKVQRPVPPPAPPEATASAPGRQGSDSKGDSQGRAIDQIKERFGNKLPGDLGTLDNLSPEVKDKLLKSGQGQELLKKFLGN
jgi:hypothetical protein